MTAAPAAAPLAAGAPFWTATAIFVGAYALIVSERVHKTVVALAGAVLLLALKVLDQHEAFHVEELGVDWNVIFVLIAMMVIVNVVRQTGAFEYLAIRCAKLGRGDPFRILVVFAVVTAALSALLDNVTTVLLIAPITLFVADALDVDPVPYLISGALASNIGGTATLIGDPPNIMIASRAQLTFMDFVRHLTPAVLVIMAAYLLLLRLFWRRQLRARPELAARVMAMDEREAIRDRPLLARCLAVLALVLLGFVFHGALGLAPATVALGGMCLLLLLARVRDPHHLFAEVEWGTIFFFIGLFVIVGGVVKVGLISWLAARVLALTGGSLLAGSMVVLWFSAFASAIVDNIPYVATMNPLIADLAGRLWPGLSGTALLQHPDLMPLWWSLALGACLGGNGTAIGASANVIVVGLAEKAGRRISFGRFLLYGMPVMVATVAIAAAYVWLRYYVLKW